MTRDTDIDWAEIGTSQPFYGVLTDDRFLRENMTEDHLALFYQKGVDEVDAVMSSIRARFGSFLPRKAIDFGCGTGRLTRAIARHSKEAIGVDISPGMLAQARKGAPGNARFVAEIPQETVDWIMSYIVFQHIPPARGYSIFAELLKRLAPGGVFSIHFNLYKDRSFLQHALATVDVGRWDGETLYTYADTPHPVGTMMMYDYDLTRLFAIANAADVDSLYLDHLNHGGNHGALIYGRRRG